ncbi:alpha/beta hydrolase fold domain-containing protein, partial [Enterococcus faecalis]|uniref:alpha/beta hydrolase fold domain-containing protein n=1 Tax=Enterococcus faecalis TaxID=1351 RepID=UPI003D6C0DFB
YGSLAPEPSRTNFARACRLDGLNDIVGVAHRDIMVPVTDGEIRVRLYEPDEAEGAGGNGPLVVFLHGGGWVIGSNDTHDGICRLLARQSG